MGKLNKSEFGNRLEPYSLDDEDFGDFAQADDNPDSVVVAHAPLPMSNSLPIIPSNSQMPCTSMKLDLTRVAQGMHSETSINR